MATVKENLIAAKALIDTPEKWSKGCGSGSCFCAVTAIAEVLNRLVTDDTPEIAAVEAARSRNWPDVMEFNDDPAVTHADVMALFQRAIDAQDGQS